MKVQESRVFRLRARGPMACFSRPEMKVERVSYEVMTPSAARGLLESVLWKPAIRWRVQEITVLAPIAWTSFRRNEVKQRMSEGVMFFADDPDRRAQRNTVALRDVDYVVSASFRMTERAGPEDSVRKFEEMFERRLEKGQTFQAPYLGCREFVAAVEPAPEQVRPIQPEVDRPLGWMFYDFDYREGGTVPLFFNARLTGGRLKVPPLEEVLRSQVGAGEGAR
ncbi:type I-C CRISPR-associated protein Cas5c [Corallococcus carmarthensis]|uniref:type I-C CRISPR-associated protein Cas5c n=1 Tax=Corallococcus carmarthensis TaxID=2316728 RepID=UPI00148B8953|nr:type I-C CRISPR-associated protein Cas5c [Corallococcus carmarthensis]NOK18603.1 type I-C CRISPR-associated protein Cas5 [Corallococcus carmarthensis]